MVIPNRRFMTSVLLALSESINLRYILSKVPSRHPWLQGHSAILGQRISATKAAASLRLGASQVFFT